MAWWWQDRSRSRRLATPGDRGQSNPIGLVLLLAIVMIGVTFTFAVGSQAIDSSQGASRVNAAEHAMTQFDSKTSLVALGSSDVQRTTIPSTDSESRVYLDAGTGWLNVSVMNRTNPDQVERVVLNESLGELVYEYGEVSIAYQGGGVWKRTPAGVQMVSPPEFHYRRSIGGQDPTLTLPLVVVDGDRTPAERVRIEADGATETKYPVKGNPDLSNPLTEGKVVVTVHSDYYRAWADFFRERTGGSVTVDDGNRTVSITMLLEPPDSTVDGGIVSSVATGGQTLTLDSNFETDSYNSTVGDYGASGGSDGSIIVAGNVEMHSNSRIKGTLKTGGTVSMHSNSEIEGDLYYHSLGTMDGTVQGATVNDPPEINPQPVNGRIDSLLSEYSDPAANDNDKTGHITGNQLEECTSSCTLDDGVYYLTDLELGEEDDETLYLDNDDGNITIVVEGRFFMDGSSEIHVTDQNDHPVRIYLGSTDSNQAFEMESNSRVVVPGDRSPLMWVYLRPGTGVRFNSNSVFTGVVYKPDTAAKLGDIRLNSNSIVKGGLVGNVDHIDSNARIHFDEALTEQRAVINEGPTLAIVNYLHVTVTRVNVTAS